MAKTTARKKPGPKPSGESKTVTSVALNSDLYERTRRYAGTHETTMRQTIQLALSEYLQKREA
ncbi:MAG: hypothetical protein IJH04_07235 [Eggerthellaceae bacterium]|nr:hypothetical protein [Eggerthellaceae bacterium]